MNQTAFRARVAQGDGGSLPWANNAQPGRPCIRFEDRDTGAQCPAGGLPRWWRVGSMLRMIGWLRLAKVAGRRMLLVKSMAPSSRFGLRAKPR